MKFRLAFIVPLALAGHAVTPAAASEWGCEVLLCAASANPSWRGVESCHPPMERLISAMKKPGFSWPTCPEGGAGEPGYERYAECPAGWTPSADQDDPRTMTAKGQSRCKRTVNQCGGWRTSDATKGGREGLATDRVTRFDSDGNSCAYTESMARPLRTDPYFFDIRDDTSGASNRFWFRLQK